jgi:hypothetical protein
MANKKINQLVSKTAILSTDIFGIGDATTGQLFKKTIAELQAAIGGAVISVNGLVGTVVLDTDDIQELATPTNKYFTDARARGAISLTVTGNSGASTYSSGTGVLNVPTYTLAGLGGISATFLSGTSGISYNSSTGVISYSGTVYTDASIRALLSGSTGISYNSTTGAISYSGTVYTDSSVRSLISLTTTGTSGASTYNNTTGVINVPNYTLAGLGGISYTSLSGGTGITYNNTTGAISYSGTVYTDASVRALISASGAVSYNNTTGVISLTSGNLTEATSSVLTITGGTGAVLGAGTSIQVKQATTSVSGFLSSTDWNTFNNKQATLTNPVTGTGTTNYVAKFTSSSAIGNSALQEVSGNVAIGITPNASVTIGKNFEVGFSGGGIWGAGQNQTYLSSNYYYASGDKFAGTGYAQLIGLSGGGVYFQTSTASGTVGAAATLNVNMFISSTGQVGIGNTTSPNRLLEVASGGDAGYIRVSGNRGNADGVHVGGIEFYNSNSSILVGEVKGITGTGGTQSSSGQLAFYTNNAGSFAERMRIASNGDINFAQSRAIATTASSGYLALYGNGGGMYFGGSNANQMYLTSGGNLLIGTLTDNGERLYVIGAIRATGTITANSDISLKKNLLKIENALEKVEQINGYTYEFKEDDSKRHAGVIAQEIQTVLPEIVNKGNDGILGVEYGNISALLIEAIKEQNTKIKNLETLLASK